MNNNDEHIDEVLIDWSTSFFDDAKDHEELFDDDGNYLEKSGNSKIDAEIEYIYNELDESLQIDTGSIDDFNKERINEITGQKVKNYVDNDTFCNAVILWNAECKAADEAGTKRPPMPDVIGMQMIRMAEGLSRRFNFRNYCVDTETEALTQRGWLNVDQITTEDIILSMDPSDGKLKWSKIHEIFRNDNYDGEMFKLEGSTIDALVTPGHKFLTSNGLKKVEAIINKEHIITNGIPVNGPTSATYTDELVALVAWFITEGNIEKYNRVRDNGVSEYISISQSHKVNDIYCKEIESLLLSIDQNGFSVGRNETMCDFNIKRSSVITKQLLDITQDKELTIDFILALTANQRILLINTMIKGDGSVNKRQYFQKSKYHIDLFLMLCAMSGINTHTTLRKFNAGFGYAEYYIVTLTDKDRCWSERVNFNGGRRKRGMKENIPTVHYKGTIWCPRTDYGTFMCRRGKRAYITGNTYIDEMREDGVYMAIRAVKNFDPIKGKNAFAYFNRCIWQAFCTRIKIEKEENEGKMSLLKDPMYLGYTSESGGDTQIDKDRLISIYDN